MSKKVVAKNKKLRKKKKKHALPRAPPTGTVLAYIFDRQEGVWFPCLEYEPRAFIGVQR